MEDCSRTETMGDRSGRGFSIDASSDRLLLTGQAFCVAECKGHCRDYCLPRLYSNLRSLGHPILCEQPLPKDGKLASAPNFYLAKGQSEHRKISCRRYVGISAARHTDRPMLSSNARLISFELSR